MKDLSLSKDNGDATSAAATNSSSSSSTAAGGDAKPEQKGAEEGEKPTGMMVIFSLYNLRGTGV